MTTNSDPVEAPTFSVMDVVSIIGKGAVERILRQIGEMGEEMRLAPRGALYFALKELDLDQSQEVLDHIYNRVVECFSWEANDKLIHEQMERLGLISRSREKTDDNE